MFKKKLYMIYYLACFLRTTRISNLDHSPNSLFARGVQPERPACGDVCQNVVTTIPTGAGLPDPHKTRTPRAY